MPQTRLRRHDRPYYLIPIMMGMAGVLFSSQLDDPVLKGVVVLLCLGIPLLMGGNILARIHSQGSQRYYLIAAMTMLTLGAVVTVSGYSDSLVQNESIRPQVTFLSRAIGITSLLLGLLITMYTFVRSEALIDELGDRFRIVAEHMSEGIILLDKKGVIILVNQALLELYGLSEDDMVGIRGVDVARRYNAESFLRNTENTSAGIKEYRVSWKQDGKEMHAQVTETPVLDRRRHRVGTLLAIRDFTSEHRLSEKLDSYTEGLQRLVEDRTERLQVSERRLRELLLGMQEGFLTLDAAGKIQFVNDMVCEMLRVGKSSMLDKPLSDFVALEDRPRLAVLLERTAATQRSSRGEEFALLRQDGGSSSVLVSAALVKEEEGRAQEFSLVLSDVQELKEMHEELESRADALEKVNIELREMDRAKDVLLSNVSHELRTPLANIDGYIDMLVEGELGEIDDAQRDVLQVISRNAQRLLSLINEMIEFSRMEIRGIRLDLTLFSPGVLLREGVASAKPSAIQKNITLRVTQHPDVPYMWGDRGKLSQVIGILISNAIKFTPEGGTIALGITRRGISGVALSVHDEGIGIQPENQDLIFKKFYQVDSSMTRRYEGTGIGLSIAKNIVEAHQGRIEVESQPDEGSTFTIVLPDVLFAHDLFEQVRTPQEGAQVFLVHSSDESRLALSHLVEGLGYAVCEFGSGHEALRAIEGGTEQPSLVVADEALSDISGADMLGRLQGDMATDQIPIFLLKTPTEEKDSNEEELYGRGVVLEKPFTPEDFISRFNDAIFAGQAPSTSRDS